MIERPRLLDLFCGAGGAAMGYYRAGFDVVGVDIKPMPRYPFEFHQGDALEYCAAHGAEFDAIHASPPCQRYSICTPLAYRGNHPDLIAATSQALIKIGKPYALENVENARALLRNPIKLCGSMFGLGVWRHRYFEIWPEVMVLTKSCNHSNIPVLISGTRRRDNDRFEFTAQECRDAADLQWMTRKEMDKAIPPAYTEFIGHYLLEAVMNKTTQG